MSERARLLIIDDDSSVVEYLCEVLACSLRGPRFDVAARCGREHSQRGLRCRDQRRRDARASRTGPPGRGARDQAAAGGPPHHRVREHRARGGDRARRCVRLRDKAVQARDPDPRDRARPAASARCAARSSGCARSRRGRSKELVATQRRDAIGPRSRTTCGAVGCDGLITGESGAGKGALARWIHERSARRDGPIVQINCAALPAALIEAELFGVRRGAFTDARESRDGLFVEASRGHAVPRRDRRHAVEAQAKLLHVLESSPRSAGRRSGGGRHQRPRDRRDQSQTSTTRSATVASARYRSSGSTSCGSRSRHCARGRRTSRRSSTAFSRAPVRERGPLGISDEAMRWLCKQDWPGNVRELANVVERAVALTEHDTIVLDDVRDAAPGRRRASSLANAVESLSSRSPRSSSRTSSR